MRYAYLMKKIIALSLAALPLTILMGCNAAPTPQDAFTAQLMTLCGQSFTGEVVSDDAADADWRGKTLTVGPVACEVDAFYMPLAVGEDTSRTWGISPSKDSITLKHDHRLKDGSPDPVTQYGGTTAEMGTANRQEFPVDDYSIAMFKREGLTASVTNTWAVEIEAGKRFAYELSRPLTEEQRAAGDTRGRFFRAEFDLATLTPISE